jgi:hypothetical protein
MITVSDVMLAAQRNWPDRGIMVQPVPNKRQTRFYQLLSRPYPVVTFKDSVYTLLQEGELDYLYDWLLLQRGT